MILFRDRMDGRRLSPTGFIGAITTNAMPVSDGKASSSARYAFKPAADPPMPTMKLEVGLTAGIDLLIFASARLNDFSQRAIASLAARKCTRAP